MKQRLARAWPHVRAALIILHIGAIITVCSPARHKVAAPRNWEGPTSDQVFDAWAVRLTAVGIDTTRDGLREFWRARTENYLVVRDRLGAPANLYIDILFVGQGWSLFSSPKRNPAIFVIDIHHPDSGWHPLYRGDSDEHDWRSRMFENNRIRKLVGRFAKGKSTGLYVPFGNWMARIIGKEMPEHDKIRTRLWRYTTKAPGEEFDPSDGEFTHPRVIDLTRFR